MSAKNRGTNDDEKSGDLRTLFERPAGTDRSIDDQVALCSDFALTIAAGYLPDDLIEEARRPRHLRDRHRNLFYYSNGIAAGGAVQIAKLAPNLPLTYLDFQVI